MKRMSCAGLVVALFVGCGGGSSSAPSAPAAPSGPTRTTLLQTTFALGNFNAKRFDVTAPGSGAGNGTLETTADWTSAANNVDLVLTDGTCVGLNVVGICSGRPCCTILAEAESATTKPERLSMSLAPGNYSVFVLSLGPGAESGTVLITYTR